MSLSVVQLQAVERLSSCVCWLEGGGHVRSLRFALLLAFFLFNSFPFQAQSSRSALRFYEAGSEKLRKNDFEGAIADFTKAIDVSLRAEKGAAVEKRPLGLPNAFADSQTEATEIYVVDSLTADAVTSRGFARSKQGDLEGA